jgi:hypothetical protein
MLGKLSLTSLCGWACFLALTLSSLADPAATPCRIQVVEKGSGWPVPMMILTTVSNQRFITDNAGVIALSDPEYMGRKTWFSVSGDGYEMPRDSFGNRGFAFVPQPGGTQKVEVTRTNIAKRLGRLTGSGIFEESQKLGEHTDWQESGITGQDTAFVAPYAGKLFWIWGDSNLFGYPLGFYNTPGGTTPLAPLSSFEPPIAMPYDYYKGPDGIPHGVIAANPGGPIWLTAVVTLPDRDGQDHLVATYTKIFNHLDVSEIGLAEWDPGASMFKETKVVWKRDGSGSGDRDMHPGGHPSFWTDGTGTKWVYFGEGPPHMRCPATYEAWKDSSTWEKVDRPSALKSPSGEEVQIATGSVVFNPMRKRWIMIFQQRFGKPSPMGEIWYAEADAPTGPWGPCVKVVSHEKYTFYNPFINQELVPANANFTLFEGTYTQEFGPEPIKTELYNYNQILYRLDLDDPALAPAQAAANSGLL